MFGGGQHVGQRLADVVQVSDAVAAQVAQQPGGGECRRHHRGARGQRHRPAGQQRVGVKQRHRQVTDIGGRDRKPLHQSRSREGHHHVRHLNRLGLATGAGGENQHEGVGGRRLAVRGQFRGGVHRPLRGVDVDHLHARQVESVEQAPVPGVGKQDLAVGPGNVAGQRLAASGVVDPGQHIPAQACGGHRRQHLRGIPQQRSDVQWAVWVGLPDQGGGLSGRVVEILRPGPHLIAVLHRGRGATEAALK